MAVDGSGYESNSQNLKLLLMDEPQPTLWDKRWKQMATLTLRQAIVWWTLLKYEDRSESQHSFLYSSGGFLGEFSKLRKATTCFVMSVQMSRKWVQWEPSCSTRTDGRTDTTKQFCESDQMCGRNLHVYSRNFTSWLRLKMYTLCDDVYNGSDLSQFRRKLLYPSA